MESGRTRTRRRFLATLTSGVAAGLAGCGGILGNPTFVEWRQPVPSPGGSFAVDDGTVYVGSEEGLAVLDAESGERRGTNPAETAVLGRPAVSEGVAYYGATDRVYAVDDAGEEQWQTELDGAVVACATDGNRVYAATTADGADGGDGLYALDPASGDELWARSFESHPVAGAPAVDAGEVFLDAGGPASFDAASGDLNWRSERDADPATPAFSNLPAVTDSAVCYRDSRAALTIVDRTSGDVTWTADLEFAPASPVARDGVVYVGAMDGRLCYALDIQDESTLWRAPVRNVGAFGPAVDDDTVYASGGVRGSTLTALDAATGDTRWEQTFAGSLSEPILSDERVFLSEADGSDYSILAVRLR